MTAIEYWIFEAWLISILVIEEDHIVYRDYVDISVAVATPKVTVFVGFSEIIC